MNNIRYHIDPPALVVRILEERGTHIPFLEAVHSMQQPISPALPVSVKPMAALYHELGSLAATLVIRSLKKLAAMGLSDSEARAYLVAMFPLLDIDELMKIYKLLKQ